MIYTYILNSNYIYCFSASSFHCGFREHLAILLKFQLAISNGKSRCSEILVLFHVFHLGLGAVMKDFGDSLRLSLGQGARHCRRKCRHPTSCTEGEKTRETEPSGWTLRKLLLGISPRLLPHDPPLSLCTMVSLFVVLYALKS